MTVEKCLRTNCVQSTVKFALPLILVGISSLIPTAVFGTSVRLKDLAIVRGVKENQLIGYGILVGLPGTGDRAGDFTENSLSTALKGLGIDPKSTHLATKNAAAVVVTATLPPFARVGAHLDVVVSSIGSATSLEGGSLMLTPLKGADGKIYAVAQGRMVVPKRTDRGSSAFQAMLSGQIPQGAILEKDVGFDFSEQKELRYQLYSPDFTTAARVAQKINEELSGKYATAIDPGTIDVILPYGLNETPVDIVAKIENLEVEPDRTAKVVVNRRTGSVVLGEQVRVFPVALAHNNLRVLIRAEGRGPNQEVTAPEASAVAAADPNAAPNGRTPRELTVSTRGASIAEIVTSLNEVGATPEDLVFLIQALKSTGSLIAEVELQ